MEKEKFDFDFADKNETMAKYWSNRNNKLNLSWNYWLDQQEQKIVITHFLNIVEGNMYWNIDKVISNIWIKDFGQIAKDHIKHLEWIKVFFQTLLSWKVDPKQIHINLNALYYVLSSCYETDITVRMKKKYNSLAQSFKLKNPETIKIFILKI